MATAPGTRESRPRAPLAATMGRDHRQALLVLLIGMILLVILAWVFAWGAVKILSGGRAYVHAEGRWSKAQQEAVFFLDRYAERGDAADLARAREALEVPLGDRRARLALKGPAYDPDQAHAGFLQGENDPADIATMIWLFEHFEEAPYFRAAIDIWSEADQDILQLQDIATRLERQWARHDRVPAGIMTIRAELARTDQRLRAYETDFSTTLNHGLRLLETTVLVVGALVMLVFLALALLMFRWATRRIRSSEQKFWASFAHAPIGFALLSRTGECTEVNDTLCRLLGYQHRDLLGQRFVRLLHPEDADPVSAILVDSTDTSHRLERRCRHADGRVIWSELYLCPLPLNGDNADGFAVLVKDISEEKRHRERLSYEASHDALTGLFNRTHFERQLDAILAHAGDSTHHVLGFVDLDHFKAINDTCGHAAGDEVLKALATLMRGKLRVSDLLARRGGDEFAFVLRDCPMERGRVIADNIRTAITGYVFERDGHRFPLSASIGLVGLRGGHNDIEAALRAADDACYRAKHRGRDRVEAVAADSAQQPRQR
ncbi:MAG: sensor domain-containing diguanylate cyclase [Halofilum sp. (in: g-proteobacteria)]|nr:sensor domain-containing diguanylate cyclase [Halofilum sp. (in: g-proteobacteria)]